MFSKKYSMFCDNCKKPWGNARVAISNEVTGYGVKVAHLSVEQKA